MPHPTGLYPRTMADHGPCRSRREYKYDLMIVRLKLMLREAQAREEGGRWPEVEWCEREIATVTQRLMDLDAAEAKQ